MRSGKQQNEGGDAEAQVQLAELLLEDGDTQDLVEAALWYRKAAEQGHREAQFQMGRIYFLGEGISQNEMEAFEWFRKAAEQGHRRAQFQLGRM